VIWPMSFKQIQLFEILQSEKISGDVIRKAMSFFSSKKEVIEIPKYGCVVFPSDTLHAGASIATSEMKFRGFCVFQRNRNLGFKETSVSRNDEIHHISSPLLLRLVLVTYFGFISKVAYSG